MHRTAALPCLPAEQHPGQGVCSLLPQHPFMRRSYSYVPPPCAPAAPARPPRPHTPSLGLPPPLPLTLSPAPAPACATHPGGLVYMNDTDCTSL